MVSVFVQNTFKARFARDQTSLHREVREADVKGRGDAIMKTIFNDCRHKHKPYGIQEFDCGGNATILNDPPIVSFYCF